MFHVWVVLKYLGFGRKVFDLTSILAIIGMVLGVACLVVAMAVFSGFEKTLKNAIIDVVGHVMLVKRGGQISDVKVLESKINGQIPELKAYTPFVTLEAVIAHNNKISGIQIEGADPKSVHKVLNIRHRIIDGEFKLSTDGEFPTAVIGKGIAKRFEVKVGDVIKVVMPKPSRSNSRKFSPRLRKFKVSGIFDLGKYEFNQRIIVVPISAAQELASIGKNITGFRLLLNDDKQARQVSIRLLNQLGGYPYWTKDWFEVNQNLLEAVKLEKIAIFLVVLIMVIAASFNVSSTLFVNVINKYSDISILKAMGAKQASIVRLFTLQGMLLGFIGAAGGLALGLALARGFVWVQEKWSLIPSDVYKVENVGIDIRLTDMSAIFIVSFLICYLSTLLPALRGAKLKPVEGLRYE